MKDHQQQQEKQSGEHKPFYNFVAAEADKFSDVQYDNFQADALNLLQKYKRAQSQSQVAPQSQHQVTTAAGSSSSGTYYNTPSPVASVNVQLDNPLNISGFLNTPDISTQPRQITLQTVSKQQVTLQTAQSSQQ